MKSRSQRDLWVRYTAAVIRVTILGIAVVTAAYASSGREKIIYTFTGIPDGASPVSGLVADHAGNLYGTTPNGGTGSCPAYAGIIGCGTVFELSPPASPGGTWTETILYNFDSADDGIHPETGIVRDGSGNLYGTTSAGGGTLNNGTVFELSPPSSGGGAWTETVLYRFYVGCCGSRPPLGPLALRNGNVYGTSRYGGTCDIGGGCGTVFELKHPDSAGKPWKQTIIHNFESSADDAFPSNGLVFDRRGALYGTTSNNPANGTLGKVFQLVQKNGNWTENVLFTFEHSSDGDTPHGLTFDQAGDLYGTTDAGGTKDFGTVFKLTPPAASGDPWTETVLYSFLYGKDGANPNPGLVFDKAGNVYGTALRGGLHNSLANSYGTAFELSPPQVTGGAWTETTLHEFGGPVYNDGNSPGGGLVFSNGKLYGTTGYFTIAPGAVGTVFSITVVP